jgi:hypothetical protein
MMGCLKSGMIPAAFQIRFAGAKGVLGPCVRPPYSPVPSSSARQPINKSVLTQKVQPSYYCSGESEHR